MIEKNEVDLAKRTTFKIGGIAEHFFIPESDVELMELIKKLKKENKLWYILSGGSNLLIDDKKRYENVIYMEKVDTTITMIEEGYFYIGASNRIQKIIREVNKLGYGGFEELFCLPAMFGGIIYMNAGIGGRNNVKFNISDFISKVKVFDIESEKIILLNKEDCNFEYRKSIFKNKGFIILGAEIKLNKQEIEDSNKRIEKRIEYCKNNQEWGKGCFGSCFSNFSPKILKVVSLFYRNKKGVRMARNNSNWLVNDGTGSYNDAITIIKRCCFLHRILHRDIEREVIIWK